MNPINVRPCKRCSKETLFRSKLDKYCRPCAAVCDLERKHRWQARQPKIHRPLSEREIIQRKQREQQRINHGSFQNREDAHDISWPAEVPIDIASLMRFSIPFDFGLSKNAMWSMARGANYVFMSAKHKTIRESIIRAITKFIERGATVFQGKIWLDILIQKPSHRGDAVNMVDGICDAVKSAIGIDDNWFCIRKLDWQIVKENPRIFIGIGQEITEHHQVCSYCGQILPLASFGIRKHGPLGRARVCLNCNKADDAVRRNMRRLNARLTEEE